MIALQITGLKELQADLKDFSQRRMNAAVATALTRTARKVEDEWKKQISANIDRPTPLTQRATMVMQATAQTLVATVMLKDRARGLSPDQYLSPHEVSGQRFLKKFEQALAKSGAMPEGYFVVPGRAAVLDGYGNVSRSQITHVIAQLGMDYSPGYQRTISKSTTKRMNTAQKHGRKYVSVLPQYAKQFKVSPGIYEMQPDGSRKAVFVFKRSTTYRKRLSLMERGAEVATKVVQQEFDKAIAESLARLSAKR